MTNLKIRSNVFRIILSTVLLLIGVYFTYRYIMLVRYIEHLILIRATHHGGLRTLNEDKLKYTQLEHSSIRLTVMVAFWIILELIQLKRVKNKQTDK